MKEVWLRVIFARDNFWLVLLIEKVLMDGFVVQVFGTKYSHWISFHLMPPQFYCKFWNCADVLRGFQNIYLQSIIQGR